MKLAQNKSRIQFKAFDTEGKAKASGKDHTLETFGSALKGEGYKDGNTNSWYVAEMAEKRAMSRAVLKMTGLLLILKLILIKLCSAMKN